MRIPQRKAVAPARFGRLVFQIENDEGFMGRERDGLDLVVRGSQHARLYSELARRSNGRLEFVGLFDTDTIRVRAVTEKSELVVR